MAALPCLWSVNFSLKVFKETLIHLFCETHGGSSHMGTASIITHVSRLSPILLLLCLDFTSLQVPVLCPCGFFLHLLCLCLFLSQGSHFSKIFLWRALSLSKVFHIFPNQWGDNFKISLDVQSPRSYPGHPWLYLQSPPTKGFPSSHISQRMLVNSLFRDAETEVQKG